MLKAKVEWLEVRLGLRVTKRLLDKNRVETLDDDGKSLEQERRLANIPRCRTQPPTQTAQKVTRRGGDWPQSLKGYRLKRVALYYYYYCLYYKLLQLLCHWVWDNYKSINNEK